MQSTISIVVATWIFFLAGSSEQALQAQTPAGSPVPTADFTYHLQRSAVADTSPPLYLWTIKSPPGEGVRIDGMAFKSLSSPTLRKWILDFQQGSVPFIYVAEKHSAGQDDTAAYKQLVQDLNDFTEFCRSHRETFVIRPPEK